MSIRLSYGRRHVETILPRSTMGRSSPDPCLVLTKCSYAGRFFPVSIPEPPLLVIGAAHHLITLSFSVAHDERTSVHRDDTMSARRQIPLVGA